ncbi:expansin 1 family protein [Dorcoceras hygrometricum]|uniref:Expansin 1 family protein n=1 Tax=Dorcoceras hygrometricum TaxID=472368 RepID=A0A2Z7CEL7_9LAMI|nr:expansin 1 family protein [Dorcoceras hygrometricum]
MTSKIRMQAHLAAQDDDRWFVITDGPIKIMKTNTVVTISSGAPQWVDNPRHEFDWTVKMRIRPPDFKTSICDVKYHVSLALSMIPRGSWGDVSRRFTMVKWVDQKICFLIDNEL